MTQFLAFYCFLTHKLMTSTGTELFHGINLMQTFSWFKHDLNPIQTFSWFKHDLNPIQTFSWFKHNLDKM